MFESFGFVVNLPPLHAEKFGEHALDQVMAEGEFAGDLASGRGESDQAVTRTRTRPSFFRRRKAMVTAGGDTLSSRRGVRR